MCPPPRHPVRVESTMTKCLWNQSIIDKFKWDRHELRGCAKRKFVKAHRHHSQCTRNRKIFSSDLEKIYVYMTNKGFLLLLTTRDSENHFGTFLQTHTKTFNKVTKWPYDIVFDINTIVNSHHSISSSCLICTSDFMCILELLSV